LNGGVVVSAVPWRHDSGIVVAAFLVGGLVVGLIVGRWRRLAAALPIGVWLAFVNEVDEVPGWLLALGYGACAAVGIGAGILLRRVAKPS
jgi:hypothetical protein